MTQPHYPESNDKVFGVWDIAAFLLENRKTIVVFIAGTVCAAVFYLLLATPMFVATTSIIVDPTRGAELFNATSMPPNMTSDQSRVESQMEVPDLRSSRQS